MTDKIPYTLDELIEKLEEIRDGHNDILNIPRAYYTLALEIKRINEEQERILGMIKGKDFYMKFPIKNYINKSKSLRDFTDEELHIYLINNENTDSGFLACICSEVLRRQLKEKFMQDFSAVSSSLKD